MSDKTAATDRTMADVLAAHQWRRGWCCSCGVALLATDDAIAAHQADALAQAGYGDLRALLHDLHQLAADWDAPPRPDSPLDVPECSDDLRALAARHTSPAKEDHT